MLVSGQSEWVPSLHPWSLPRDLTLQTWALSRFVWISIMVELSINPTVRPSIRAFYEPCDVVIVKNHWAHVVLEFWQLALTLLEITGIAKVHICLGHSETGLVVWTTDRLLNRLVCLINSPHVGPSNFYLIRGIWIDLEHAIPLTFLLGRVDNLLNLKNSLLLLNSFVLVFLRNLVVPVSVDVQLIIRRTVHWLVKSRRLAVIHEPPPIYLLLLGSKNLFKFTYLLSFWVSRSGVQVEDWAHELILLWHILLPFHPLVQQISFGILVAEHHLELELVLGLFKRTFLIQLRHLEQLHFSLQPFNSPRLLLNNLLNLNDPLLEPDLNNN